MESFRVLGVWDRENYQHDFYHKRPVGAVKTDNKGSIWKRRIFNYGAMLL